MDGKQLEKIMMDFIEGKYDVLLATTIIESGIDIERDNVTIGPVPGAVLGENKNFGVAAAKALEAGLIDGFWANGMGSEVAILNGVGSLLLDARRGDGPAGSVDYTFPAFVTTQRKVEEKPAEAQAAMRAIVNAQQALKRDPSLAVKAVKNHFPPAETALIAELIRRDAPFFDAAISRQKLDALNDFSRSMGILSGPKAYGDVVAECCRSVW
jgi:ABC-type nitrate/sulfonate/bicarbonate transport system substrate-binding protein